ncbi:MAG: AraC family transcriptional regulator [Burkholderiales bacterium]|nr:AraC family transcriptional regulator [Burkholderiales bacterium]
MSTPAFVRDPASVRLLVQFGEQRGLAASALLRRTGLVLAQLSDPGVEVLPPQELQVIANLIRLTNNPPWLGLEVGLQYGFTTYGIWGYGLISSATVAEALARAMRYLPLTYAFSRIAVMQEGSSLVLGFGPPGVEEPLRSFLVQRDLAAATRLIADLTGPSFAQLVVRLAEAAPVSAAQRACLPDLGAVCQFGASTSAILVDAAQLEHELPNANPLTASTCEQMCAALVERRRARHGTAELVRAHLAVTRGQVLPNLAQMAQLLYSSERTFKRRLEAEGTSFRQLLAQARQEHAQELLSDESLALDAIANHLGFSDASSFSQAFKRWSGAAPGQWRKRVHAA